MLGWRSIIQSPLQAADARRGCGGGPKDTSTLVLDVHMHSSKTYKCILIRCSIRHPYDINYLSALKRVMFVCFPTSNFALVEIQM